MFNKRNFSQILQQINETYPSMTEFAKRADFDRTYISKYINMKLDNPPSPKILEKIANSSHGIVTYAKLMSICGYLNSTQMEKEIIDKYNLSSTDFDYIKPKLPNLNSLSDYEKEILSNALLKYSKSRDKNQFNIESCLNNELNSEQKNRIKKVFNSLMNEISKSADKFKNIQDLNNFKSQYYMCPVYGRIAAGQPNWAEECIESRIPIDPDLMNIANPEECFFLKVNGESMNKIVKNHSYALIRKQDVVENGEIAVVLVNGYDATLKKFTKQGDIIVLEPISDDPDIKTQIYDKNTSIKIIGKYIGKFELDR